MRWNLFNKRYWKDYFKSLKRTNWSFVILFIIFIEIVAAFLFYYLDNKIIWTVILTINTLLLLIISWKILLLTISFILLFIISFHYIDQIPRYKNGIDDNFKIIRKYNNGVVIQKNFNKFYLETSNSELSINDLIYLKTNKVEKIVKNDKWNNYLKSENIKYQIKNFEEFIKLNKKSSIIENIRNYFTVGGNYYLRYVPLILLGIKNPKNKIIVEKFNSLNILHLLVISGFHINLLIYLINFIFKKILKIKNKYFLLIVPLSIIPYILVTDYGPSTIRAFVFCFLIYLNKIFFNNKFSKLNILSLIGFCFILINPFIVFSLSFSLSFSISFLINAIISNSKNKNTKKKILLIIPIISSLISSYLNNKINILFLINNLVLSPIISISYLISFCFFWIKPIMNNYFNFIDIIVNVFDYIKYEVNIKFSLELLISIYSLTLFTLIVTNKYELKIKSKNWTWWTSNYFNLQNIKK